MFEEPDPLPPAFQQALRFTSFGFEQYVKRAAQDGARLLVLGSHELSDRQESRLKSILSERGITYVSLKAHIAATGQPIAAAQWRHDAHWSPKGHVWAAESIATEIGKQGLCSGG
jgi:hypothetical protein